MIKWKKNIAHPAATGRFADYGDAASNFFYLPLEKNHDKDYKKSHNLSLFGRLIISNLFWITISLLMSIMAVSVFSGGYGDFNPTYIFLEYSLICIFLSLFFILIIKNRIIYRFGKGDESQNFDVKKLPVDFKDCIENMANKDEDINFIRKRKEIFKPFILGTMNGAVNGKNKKSEMFPDLVIGLDRKKRFEHLMIISPTGGGKTTRYIIPAIMNDAEYGNVSVFAIDIDSPYLYDAVKEKWLKNGKKVVNFDPYFSGNSENVMFNGMHYGMHFNPLVDSNRKPLPDDKLYGLSSLLFHIDKSEAGGGDIHAHKYYAKRSTDTFYGCLLFIKYSYEEKYFNLVTAKKFFERGAKFMESLILKYNGDNAKKIKEVFNNFIELPVYERAKVITGILNELDFLNDETVAERFKSGSDIESEEFFMDDFFDADTLFITAIPKEKISAGGEKLMSFMANILISRIYEDRRKKLRNDTGKKGNRSERDIFIYLDEFPALSLNDFDIELANLRKTNTGVCLAAQDISFIKNRYGDASLITANVGTQLVMGNPSYETGEYYSKRSGLKYVSHRELLRKNIKFGGSLAYGNLQETPVASGLFPLISPEELKNMDKESVFVYSKFVNPMILKAVKPFFLFL